MKTITVKNFMVPLSEYATVPEEATLFEAVIALEEAQEKFDQSRHRHRALLIFDKNDQIVGKMSELDILSALEPKYKTMGDHTNLSRFGFSSSFVKSMLDNYSLWDKPLNDICRKAGEIRVKNFMYTPTKGEFVNENASLDEAIHQLIMGHHQSLLVIGGKKIVGILRLCDIFREICNVIKFCSL